MTVQPPDLSICGCGTRLSSERKWSEHVKTCDRAVIRDVLSSPDTEQRDDQ